jgi:hypothetical protein
MTSECIKTEKRKTARRKHVALCQSTSRFEPMNIQPLSNNITAETAAQVDSWINELREVSRSRVPDSEEAINANYDNARRRSVLMENLLGAFEHFDDFDPVEIDLECRFHIANIGDSKFDRVVDAFRRLMMSDKILYARLRRSYYEEYRRRFGIELGNGERRVVDSPVEGNRIFLAVENRSLPPPIPR